MVKAMGYAHTWSESHAAHVRVVGVTRTAGSSSPAVEGLTREEDDGLASLLFGMRKIFGIANNLRVAPSVIRARSDRDRWLR